MKKLISLLMALLMMLGCAAALAEDVIGGADEATEIVVAAESNLIMDGLLVTVVGLAGVFLGIKYTLYPSLGSLVVKGFIACVIGGLGSLTGAVIGAILLGLLETCLPYAKTNMSLSDMGSIAMTVLQSGLLDRVAEGGSLLEQNRIPMDATWKYDTTDSGASVVAFRTSKRLKENIEALHEFIYGEYYPAD